MGIVELIQGGKHPTIPDDLMPYGMYMRAVGEHILSKEFNKLTKFSPITQAPSMMRSVNRQLVDCLRELKDNGACHLGGALGDGRYAISLQGNDVHLERWDKWNSTGEPEHEVSISLPPSVTSQFPASEHPARYSPSIPSQSFKK